MVEHENLAIANPYATVDSPISDRYLLNLDAGLWRRLGNVIADEFSILVVSLLLAGLLLLLLRVELPGYRFAVLLDDLPTLPLAIAIRFLYYIILEWRFGRTLGKVFTQTRVVSEYGGRPSLWAVVVRTLCRMIPFEFVSIYFSARKRCWHDVLSGTRVTVVYS